MRDLTATEIQRLGSGTLLEVLRRTHLSAAPDLARVVAEEARPLGVDPLVLYLLDYEQKCLVPVPGPGAHDRGPLPVQGTMAGRAFIANAILDLDDDAVAGAVHPDVDLLAGQRPGADLAQPDRRGLVGQLLGERVAHEPAHLRPGDLGQRQPDRAARREPEQRAEVGRGDRHG